MENPAAGGIWLSTTNWRCTVGWAVAHQLVGAWHRPKQFKHQHLTVLCFSQPAFLSVPRVQDANTTYVGVCGSKAW